MSENTAEVGEVSDVTETPEIVEGTQEAAAEIKEEAPAELQAELVKKIQELELKIDGETVKEKLPFEVTEEQAKWLQKELQLARAANKRMQEAAELRKKDIATQEEIQGFLQALKQNPIEILESMGIDTKDMSEKRLQAEIEKMQMTEEERKIAELQKELQELKSKEEAAKKQAELMEQEKLKSQYAAEYERDLINAIDSSGLPKNPEIIQRLAQYMHTALRLGIDLNFKDLIPLVQQSIQSDLTSLLGSLPIEQIMQILGDGNIQKIIGSKKPAVSKKAPVTPKSVQDTATKKDKEDPFKPKFKTGNLDDFFRNL